MPENWKNKDNKFKREWFLNRVANRFQLNYKRNVGATSESIRKCSPKSLEEWKTYYFTNIKPKEHIESLGKRLHSQLKTIVKDELESISEQECIDWLLDLVINRVYQGYVREKQIIKELLKNELNVEIKEAPDEWDRIYGVDFFIEINEIYIGLQIKPQILNLHYAGVTSFVKEQNQNFQNKYGGKVFIIYSIEKGEEKIIQNKEIVDEIKKEIQRLSITKN